MAMQRWQGKAKVDFSKFTRRKLQYLQGQDGQEVCWLYAFDIHEQSASLQRVVEKIGSALNDILVVDDDMAIALGQCVGTSRRDFRRTQWSDKRSAKLARRISGEDGCV